MPEVDRQESDARAGERSGSQRSEDVMSQQILEERVGTLEARVGDLKSEQARQGQELRSVSDKVSDVASGVKSLLERESRRPHGVTWREFFAGIMTAVTVGGGLWWTVSALVEHSPAVVSMEKRLDRAEWKYGWAARVDTP